MPASSQVLDPIQVTFDDQRGLRRGRHCPPTAIPVVAGPLDRRDLATLAPSRTQPLNPGRMKHRG
jgi:hypothetical protein